MTKFYRWARTKEAGIKDVHFLGYVSEGQKRWLYENGAVDVNPSKSEGFGLQCLECMIYDTPMVVSNATCLPEVAGETAIYFDPNSVEELVSQTKKALEMDPEVKVAMSKYKKQLKLFSWHKMAKESHQIYKDSIG